MGPPQHVWFSIKFLQNRLCCRAFVGKEFTCFRWYSANWVRGFWVNLGVNLTRSPWSCWLRNWVWEDGLPCPQVFLCSQQRSVSASYTCQWHRQSLYVLVSLDLLFKHLTNLKACPDSGGRGRLTCPRCLYKVRGIILQRRNELFNSSAANELGGGRILSPFQRI